MSKHIISPEEWSIILVSSVLPGTIMEILKEKERQAVGHDFPAPFLPRLNLPIIPYEFFLNGLVLQ